MTTILFGWELGAGLGHVAPLAAVARAIRGRCASGAVEVPRLVFALRDPHRSRILVEGLDAPVLPAPVFREEAPVQSAAASYADILIAAGFVRETTLRLAVSAWDDLLDFVGPDLVIADHSPTLMLAARGRVRLIATGTGYTLPPTHLADFPSLHADREPASARRPMLANVNGLLAERGVAPLERLPQLLEADARALFTLPHLDPYIALRKETVLGPYEEGLEPQPPPEELRLYYYGRAEEPHLPDILDVLVATRAKVSVYFVAGDPASVARLRARGVVVHEELPDTAEEIAKASAVLFHGGAGIAMACLMIGRPMIVMPIHDESEVTAMRVDQAGAGIVVEDVTPDALAAAVDAVLTVPSYRNSAREIAEQIAANIADRQPVRAVADRAVALLADR